MAFPELRAADLSLSWRVKIVLCGWRLCPEALASLSLERGGSPVDRRLLRLFRPLPVGEGGSFPNNEAPLAHKHQVLERAGARVEGS